MPKPEIVVADCLGACSGVNRALRLFDGQAGRLAAGQRLYVLHELVHNSEVTRQMQARGAQFITSPTELPAGEEAFIGAHGATLEEETSLTARTTRLTDATCPVVHRLHEAVAALTETDELVICGQAAHQEIRSLLSRSHAGHNFLVTQEEDIAALPELKRPCLLCQTTLDYRESLRFQQLLAARFPHCRILGIPCRASQERQQAVERLAQTCDALLVIGSRHSANANRLREIGLRAGIPSWLANMPEELPPEWMSCRRLGVTAAASTTDALIQQMLDFLNNMLSKE